MGSRAQKSRNRRLYSQSYAASPTEDQPPSLQSCTCLDTDFRWFVSDVVILPPFAGPRNYQIGI